MLGFCGIENYQNPVFYLFKKLKVAVRILFKGCGTLESHQVSLGYEPSGLLSSSPASVFLYYTTLFIVCQVLYINLGQLILFPSSTDKTHAAGLGRC